MATVIAAVWYRQTIVKEIRIGLFGYGPFTVATGIIFLAERRLLFKFGGVGGGVVYRKVTPVLQMVSLLFPVPMSILWPSENWTIAWRFGSLVCGTVSRNSVPCVG